MKRDNLVRNISICHVFLFSMGGSAFALEKLNYNGADIQPGLEIGLGYIDHRQQAFGGTFSAFGLPIDKHGRRTEGYVKPSLAVEAPTEELGTIYGKASYVGTTTRGDSDGLGFTRNDPTDTDWDDGYIGWKSGKLLDLGQDAVSLSVGRQPFMIGNGFLIGEGHIDQGHEGAYWLGPRRAFDWTVLAQLDVDEFHGDAFHLRTRQDIDVIDHSERVTVDGANAEWRSKEYGTYGITAFSTSDTNSSTRDELKVYDVRATLSPFPSLPNLTLSGEYAWQRNSDEDLSARAWYLEGTYTFSDVAGTPALTYRYSRFSEKYDSLLYGYSGDWGYWYQGEIVGEYMLFNMNERAHMLKFTVYPNQTMRAGVIGYDFQFDKAPAGVSSRDFAKELDVYVDWMPTENWTLGVLYGVADPEDGAEQLFGSSNTSNLLEAYVIFKM